MNLPKSLIAEKGQQKTSSRVVLTNPLPPSHCTITGTEEVMGICEFFKQLNRKASTVSSDVIKGTFAGSWT